MIISQNMAGTFFRALNWVANEFLVEKLANNRTFQRVALRMHEKEVKVVTSAFPYISIAPAEQEVGRLRRCKRRWATNRRLNT